MVHIGCNVGRLSIVCLFISINYSNRWFYVLTKLGSPFYMNPLLDLFSTFLSASSNSNPILVFTNITSNPSPGSHFHPYWFFLDTKIPVRGGSLSKYSYNSNMCQTHVSGSLYHTKVTCNPNRDFSDLMQNFFE